MCNACGFGCCAWDGFSGCGCDSCSNSGCWTECDPVNNIHGEDCDCPDEFFDVLYDDDEQVPISAAEERALTVLRSALVVLPSGD